MRIALLSDTHVPDQIGELPPRLIERLQDIDLILHAGDLVRLQVVEALQAIAETLAVHGNMDEPAVRRRLPHKLLLALAGINIGLIHGNQPPAIQSQYLRPGSDYDSSWMGPFYDYLLDEFPDAGVIVFGHLHVPVVKRWHGRLLVNPGPVAPNQGRSSFALLTLEGPEPVVEIIDL